MTNEFNIVFVDDNIMITDLFESYFRISSENANFYTFNDPRKALEFIQSKKKIDVFITDYKMPVYNGIELLEATSSDTTRVLVSGYISEIAEERLLKLNTIIFEKPVPMKKIGKIISDKCARKSTHK